MAVTHTSYLEVDVNSIKRDLNKLSNNRTFDKAKKISASLNSGSKHWESSLRTKTATYLNKISQGCEKIRKKSKDFETVCKYLKEYQDVVKKCNSAKQNLSSYKNKLQNVKLEINRDDDSNPVLEMYKSSYESSIRSYESDIGDYESRKESLTNKIESIMNKY